MRIVDMIFDATDSERNAVPKFEMRLPGAAEAAGTESPIRRPMDDAEIRAELKTNKLYQMIIATNRQRQ
jgi:hypothetical protein